MAKRGDWTAEWSALALLAVALLVVGAAGLWGYVSRKDPPVHPASSDVPSAPASTLSPRWAAAAERARRIVRQHLAERNVPGASVAVGVGDRIVWAEGFGWADIESRRAATPDTRYRIGTASIALTSAAAGLLVEEGRLLLDDEIQRYVPEFPRKESPVTLRQVMGHVSGLRTDGGDESPLFRVRCRRPVEALPHFADRGLRFEPGTRFRPSTYGWILVSAAIEAASQQPFMGFMQSRVFEPIGMKDTLAETPEDENPGKVGEPEEDPPIFTFIRHVLAELGVAPAKPRVTSRVPNLATSYFPRFGGDPRYGMHLTRPHNLSCYAGAMAFISTAPDLARFALALNNGRLLRPETVQELQTSLRLTNGDESGYGLGWNVGTAELAGQPAGMAGHDGNILGGATTTLLSFPDRGLVVAVTTNISYADTASLARRIAEVFADMQGSGARP